MDVNEESKDKSDVKHIVEVIDLRLSEFTPTTDRGLSVREESSPPRPTVKASERVEAARSSAPFQPLKALFARILKLPGPT